jgi:hypothetical protein
MKFVIRRFSLFGFSQQHRSQWCNGKRILELHKIILKNFWKKKLRCARLCKFLVAVINVFGSAGIVSNALFDNLSELLGDAS